MAATESLYLVTDRHVSGGAGALVARVARALVGAPRGSVLVQLREKDLDDDALVRIGADLRTICRAAGARLVVNGRVDLVQAIGADGVHLRDDASADVAAARAALGPGALVAASTHSAEAAVARARAGADLVTLGPVWPTASKPGAAAIGLAPLAAAATGACVFALGGVAGPAQAAQAVRAGAAGVAVIRAVLAADDPGAAAAALVAAARDAQVARATGGAA